MNDVYNWIKEKNENTEVKVIESKLSLSNFWFYDMYNGRIINRKNSFFSIYGAEYISEGTFQVEQPIIIQNELLNNESINKYYLKSIYSTDINDELNKLFHMIDNRIMFHNDKVILKPLYELREWKILDEGIYCNESFNYNENYIKVDEYFIKSNTNGFTVAAYVPKES